MSHDPHAGSLSPQAIEIVAQRLGVSTSQVSVTPIKQGMASSYTLRTPDQSYLVKVDGRSSRRHVPSEQAIIRAANQNGIPTCPLNLFALELPDVTISVRRWIEGIELSNACYLELNKAASIVHLLGSTLSKIHDVAGSRELKYNYDFSYGDCDDIWNEIEQLLSDQNVESVYTELRYATTYVQNCDKSSLRNGIGMVHGDFKPDNLLLTNAGIAVLDWKKATIGSQMIDLGFAGFHLVSWLIANRFPLVYIDLLRLGYSSNGKAVDGKLFGRLIRHAACTATLYDAVLERRARSLSLPEAERRTEYFWGQCVPHFRRYLRAFRQLDALWPD